MLSLIALSGLIASAVAVEPFWNEPDTGLETYLHSTNWTEGTQPLLKDMRGIPDFDFAARQSLDGQKYSFYRTANAGEWSYRNNLEIWSKVHFRTRHLTDVTKVNQTLATTILGYNFSAPVFISPAARGAYGDPDRAELNFVEASAKENTLYTAALYASKTIEEIAAAKSNDTLNGPQVLFQQIYTNANLSVTWDIIDRAEKAGAKAFVWTIDAPATSVRHRAARYDTTNANAVTSALTWDIYDQIKNHTKLPIIPKGITTVEDALLAIEKGAKAIYISNHGARQLDHSPSPLEIAYEIYRNAPEVFTKVEVLADSGVRYGSDVLKLLALGVKAVGLGRPFMYANCFGLEGVTKAIQILKSEIAADAAQAGIQDIQKIPTSILNLRALEPTVFLQEGTKVTGSL
ncbi:FMN-dependent alpha-hydroxy acid dehydrogenase [Pleomassaria siparia CBS 279.74]|uniref:FMN-dependent alpha-hydroxy acid dehydrogenase n=1 Tax=Pleomassaria siparia CBS 279.74 TaxID=1314801 RepID=A0A6G1KI82_9PLEO|nr:FMN-dependent alpha-hydroxy acid dehydrogenase [Pleomassaria siparia CBS 279.74]